MKFEKPISPYFSSPNSSTPQSYTPSSAQNTSISVDPSSQHSLYCDCCSDTSHSSRNIMPHHLQASSNAKGIPHHLLHSCTTKDNSMGISAKHFHAIAPPWSGSSKDNSMGISSKHFHAIAPPCSGSSNYPLYHSDDDSMSEFSINPEEDASSVEFFENGQNYGAFYQPSLHARKSSHYSSRASLLQALGVESSHVPVGNQPQWTKQQIQMSSGYYGKLPLDNNSPSTSEKEFVCGESIYEDVKTYGFKPRDFYNHVSNFHMYGNLPIPVIPRLPSYKNTTHAVSSMVSGLKCNIGRSSSKKAVLNSLGDCGWVPSSTASELELILPEDKSYEELSIDNKKERIKDIHRKGGERVVWEFHNVCLTRVPGYGFGIAVSGGRDNPHFTNGDPSIAISDVLKAGPAEGKLQINDRLISANGVSLENVEYARAVQVLRDSGAAVQLVVKRRIVLPAQPEPQTLKITLNKNRKKDDFGIVLGCRIYVKEIGNRNVEKEGGLREGDVLLRINSTSTENLTVKEARKLLEGTKDRLQLLVRREPPPPQGNSDLTVKDMRGNEYSDSRPNYSSQNLYVQPPTRGGSEPTRIGGPQAYPGGHETPESKNNLMRQGADPRFVSFKKEGSVGIRLAGGNEVGIYVTAVQPGSQAQLQGLIPGDKILKVNDMDMSGVTREEAVLYLMSLQDQIDLIVQTCKHDYDHILNNTKGDLFYIKTHFHYEPNGKNELSFRSGDIFRVVDTLHNGVVGAWQVHRIGRNNQETQKGIVPNKARAEELATAQFNAAKKEQTQSETRGGFFKRRRNSRRSKSLGKDHWEDVVFADSVSKFPAYERVTLRHPGFVRPIVLFGPLSDIARDNLMKENPAKFASPQLDSHGEKANGIIRLSAIREIMERGKHAVLDITPNAVDRLNYAQFYPVVIFLRAESKQIVKELRSGYPKGRMNSKKLYDQSVKLEKLWSHVYTATVSLTQPDTWYRKVREIVDKQQAGPLWMSETKPTEALSDDFLFPMTSRLSYASSPESDMETGPESRTPSKSPHRGGPPSYLTNSEARHGEPRNRMVKSSSDPSLAAPEEISSHPLHAAPGHGGPPPYTASPTRMPPPQGGAVSDGLDDRRKSHGGDKLPPQGGASDGFDDRRKSHGGDSKYGFASGNYYSNDQYSSRVPGGHSQHPGAPPPGGDSGPPQSGTSPYGSPPQGYNSRHQQQQQPKQNIPPPTQSPNQRRSPLAPPGRPPPQLGPSPSGVQMPGPPPPYLNGHAGDELPPEMPPKIDRGSKPSRGITDNQDGGGPAHGGKEGDYDANYINTGRPSSLERQQKSPYDTMSPSLGPNAHDDLKSRLHPRSPQDHYRYNRSTSQPPTYRSDDPYRSSDYKPLPPPKSNNYKPVPPPKPKNYKQQTPDSGNGGYGMYESSRKNYDRTSYHTNSNGGLSDDYSGLDSGQGSSLDRKYDTFGRSSYGKVGTAAGAGRTGYYLNVPPPRDMNNQGSHGGGGGPGGRDLPNHDHRGSAFELYKKPPDPRGPPGGGPPMPPQYTDIGNR